MPNKFTTLLDLTKAGYTIGYFDAIFGPWDWTQEQREKWNFLSQQDLTECEGNLDQLFWSFIAQMSDKDLEECFPELFSDMY